MSDADTQQLPTGWSVVFLEQIAATRLGKMLDAAKQTEGQAFPYLRNINVRWLEFDLHELQLMRMTQKDAMELNICDGDVLVCEGGEPGRAAVWKHGHTNVKFQKAIHRVRVKPCILPELLVYQLKHDALHGHLDEYVTGSTIKHLTGVALKRYRVCIPPLAEQHRIVAKLEQLLAKVQSSQQRLNRIPALLKRFRQSVLAAACSGRLTADWRESGSKSYGCSSEWRTIAVGGVISDLKYGTSKKSEYGENGTPVLRIPNIGDGVVDQTELKYAKLDVAELKQLQLRVGDLLLIRSNGSVALVGKTALVRESEEGFAYAGYLIRLRPDRTKIVPQYLHLALSSYDVRLQIELQARSTSGVNNINSDEVRSLRISLPPLPEQQEIVRRVDQLFAFADKIEERFKKAQAQVDRLTQSILAKAFRGELVSTEAALAKREGRDYETAEQLLARVQAEAGVEKPATRKRSKSTKW